MGKNGDFIHLKWNLQHIMQKAMGSEYFLMSEYVLYFQLAFICHTPQSPCDPTSQKYIFVSESTENINSFNPLHSLLLRYAGMLLGITNTFGTIPGALAPIVMGYLTRDVSPDFAAVLAPLWYC